MSEYLVIVGLLAVAGIATMGFMGGSIRHTLSAFASEFAGDTDAKVKAQQTDAVTEADNAAAYTVSDLGDYDDGTAALKAK